MVVKKHDFHKISNFQTKLHLCLYFLNLRSIHNLGGISLFIWNAQILDIFTKVAKKKKIYEHFWLAATRAAQNYLQARVWPGLTLCRSGFSLQDFMKSCLKDWTNIVTIWSARAWPAWSGLDWHDRPDLGLVCSHGRHLDYWFF